jgi:hypothetical protein
MEDLDGGAEIFGLEIAVEGVGEKNDVAATVTAA